MRAIFFDRDDTLMRNVPYLGDPAGVVVYAEAAGCLGELRGLGYEAVCGEQSVGGWGRGLITTEQVARVNEEMIRQLGRNYFRQFYNSYAEPGQPGEFRRKPAPQLLYEAAREHGLDLRQSVFVGDRLADMLVGRNAGCRTILVLSGHTLHERPYSSRFADAIVPDLSGVVAALATFR